MIAAVGIELQTIQRNANYATTADSSGLSSSIRSTCASSGKKRPQTAARPIVTAPPATTAGTAPTSAAATPDSNAPSSFEALMNTHSTALTRPRSSFGVANATVVERMFIEYMSTSPL